MAKKNFKLKFSTIQSYLLMTLGLLINSFGISAFLIPGQIVGGGLSGIGTLIYFISNKTIPVGVTLFVINAILILIAMKILGNNFGIKTIYAIVILSASMTAFQQIITEPLLRDSFMATILGGALAGIGMGITFTQGGSTGGTDIIAMMINKYKDISPGRLLFFIDIVIVGSSFFVIGSFEKMLYGFVEMAVAAYAIDMVMQGNKQSIEMVIISDRSYDIARKISEEVSRGITFIKGSGFYAGEPRDIIMVVVKRNETHDILRIVNETDPGAFTTLRSVIGAYGKGFDSIKM